MLSVAIGNFDGVHRGHQTIFAAMQTPYREIITFDPHPHQFLHNPNFPLLTPTAEKIRILHEMGLTTRVLTFNQHIAALTPEKFFQEHLLNATKIYIGFNFAFGHKGAGTPVLLQQMALPFGIEVVIMPPALWHDQVISSSNIRKALVAGDVGMATQLLGRPYRLSGSVVTGDKRGRLIGFPTANLALPKDKLVPRLGVYLGYVLFDGKKEPAIANLGYRPTFSGSALRCEVHVLGKKGLDLYGQLLSFDLLEFVRPEKRFASKDDLTHQIEKDVASAQTYFDAN